MEAAQVGCLGWLEVLSVEKVGFAPVLVVGGVVAAGFR
jgi:hypothetical protein